MVKFDDDGAKGTLVRGLLGVYGLEAFEKATETRLLLGMAASRQRQYFEYVLRTPMVDLPPLDSSNPIGVLALRLRCTNLYGNVNEALALEKFPRGAAWPFGAAQQGPTVDLLPLQKHLLCEGWGALGRGHWRVGGQ